ncbi:MAG: hypothetical protein ACFFFO_10960 [Candidatus Thorarchaeota archaeon]
MNQVDTIELERGQHIVASKTEGLRGFIKTLGLATAWAFISALIVGCLAAAVWTVIPTELLAWGAGAVNRMGYISHCSFAPISTLTLFTAAAVGVGFAYRLRSGRRVGKIVFLGTAGGLLLGALIGFDIVMFMGMGAGLGIGFVIGLIVELVLSYKENKEDGV